MSGRARSENRPHDALAETARREARLAELERAHQRLQHLYDISKVLTRFQTVDRTVPEVIALVARTLPLRSAILILETAATPTAIVWQAEGEGSEALHAAKARAQAAYAYLVRSGVNLERREATFALPPLSAAQRSSAASAGDRLILLPLVVDRGAIFGALQVESAADLGELDLVFINVVANQLAIAVDRQAAINARQASAEADKEEQRLLAKVSAVIASSLDYRSTLTALSRAVIPDFADLCLIDEVRKDGTIQCAEVVFADERKQRDLAHRILRSPPRAGGPTPRSQVFAFGRAILFSDATGVLMQGISRDDEQARLLQEAGVVSMLAVPLLARETLGSLIFATAESGRRYATRDRELAEEIAVRTVIALDNARLYEQARRATQTRDDMLAIISHDLKNAVNGIMMALSLMIATPENEDRRKSRKQLAMIERSTRRMIRLIGDLLDSASIEAGRLSIEKQPVSVAPLVSEALDALQPQAASKSLRLESVVAAGLPEIDADGARLQQVLGNLIGNAIKFTPAGGTVTIRVEPGEDVVTFSVVDGGPGIAQHELSHLFDRFWQAKRTARLGTGLGLFIVKGIVEAHDGRVWVETTSGKGTTFSFTVPVGARVPHADG